jgi:hypothetical protein
LNATTDAVWRTEKLAMLPSRKLVDVEPRGDAGSEIAASLYDGLAVLALARYARRTAAGEA